MNAENKTDEEILAELVFSLSSWAPEVRVLANMTAAEMLRAILGLKRQAFEGGWVCASVGADNLADYLDADDEDEIAARESSYQAYQEYLNKQGRH